MLSCFSAVVYRRQHFLVRCLGGYRHNRDYHHSIIKMQAPISPTSHALEADAGNVLRLITPTPGTSRHKGQTGMIAVIGGCREYTGAPYFSAISALKLGADLSHVFCTKDAAPVIKGYSPELIVHPILEESYSVRDEDKASVSAKVVEEIDKWLKKFDCLVIGPGLGRDQLLMDCVSEIMKHAKQSNIPMVVDGDGLFLVTNCIDLVRDYPLAVLTPNVNEYKRLVRKVLDTDVNSEDEIKLLTSLCKRLGGVTILQKGQIDFISDGEKVSAVSVYGSPRRCAGQGDILSGSVAVFLTWALKRAAEVELDMNPTALGCIVASALLRHAAALTFQEKKRSTLSSDIIEHLGTSLEKISPVDT